MRVSNCLLVSGRCLHANKSQARAFIITAIILQSCPFVNTIILYFLSVLIDVSSTLFLPAFSLSPGAGGIFRLLRSPGLAGRFSSECAACLSVPARSLVAVFSTTLVKMIAFQNTVSAHCSKADPLFCRLCQKRARSFLFP